MSYHMEILDSSQFKTSYWSGGTTTEFAIYPPDSIYKDLNFTWRISSATVDLEESDFTNLPNITRFITPLNGVIKLTHDENKLIKLNPFDVYKFSGDVKTKSFGKVRDFNLMIGENALGNLSKINLNLDFKNICIHHKENNYDFNMLHQLFFSPFSDINVIMENSKRLILHEGDLLLISSNKPYSKLNIKLSSTKKDCIILQCCILC